MNHRKFFHFNYADFKMYYIIHHNLEGFDVISRLEQDIQS